MASFIDQLLEFRWRGAMFDQAVQQRRSVSAGVSQARTARVVLDHLT